MGNTRGTVHEDAAASHICPRLLWNHCCIEEEKSVSAKKHDECKLLNHADGLVIIVNEQNHNNVLNDDDGIFSIVREGKALVPCITKRVEED